MGKVLLHENLGEIFKKNESLMAMFLHYSMEWKKNIFNLSGGENNNSKISFSELHFQGNSTSCLKAFNFSFSEFEVFKVEGKIRSGDQKIFEANHMDKKYKLKLWMGDIHTDSGKEKASFI